MPDLAWPTLVDLATVAGVALVLPACLGGVRRWLGVGACVALACALDRGTPLAVVLAVTWPAHAVAVGARAAVAARPLPATARRARVRLVACAYALVAGTWFVISRAGGTPVGIHEPIVALTAVHFTYAGAAALVLADAALAAARSAAGRRLGAAGLLVTAAAPPIVATGFVTGAAAAQVGGAVAMSLGVYATAALQLREACDHRVPPRTRALLAASALAVVAPMALAVAWAAGQHWGVPSLVIPEMVRIHGSLNAAGFVGAGLVARRGHPAHHRATAAPVT